MDFWDILTYAAWGGSAILLSYIVIDTIVVSTKYSEEFLLSSREGEDELLTEVETESASTVSEQPDSTHE